MKRDDLQGVRGLAIISVLLFHFFPSICPNGYVGVDQFFVLSGFLMAMIFGSKEITANSIYLFYYRRVKRIVPLYLAVILGVLFLLFFVFPNTFYAVNCDSATNAILFYTNMAKQSSENAYFIMLEQADDLFTHTWSLAVEMQFYLFAPVIFNVLRLCSSFHWVASVCYLLFLGGGSLSYHLLADSSTSFNNVFCRMWQFTVGIATFFSCQWLEETRESAKSRDADTEIKEEKEEVENHHLASTNATSKTSYSLPHSLLGSTLAVSLVALVVCALFPLVLPAHFIRVATTFFTGLVIVLGTVVETNPLCFRLLTYIGDVSYSIYLLHWPIYVWVKYYHPGNVMAYCLALGAATLLAILVSETFEKCYQSLDKVPIFVLLAAFYTLLILLIVNKDSMAAIAEKLTGPERVAISPGMLTKNYTNDEVIRLNNQFDHDEHYNQVIHNCFPNSEHGFCTFPPSTLSGNLSIFILGNSYTPNMGMMVHKHFARFAKNMTKYSVTYCEVLVTKKDHCEDAHNTYLNLTEQLRPDVIIMVARHIIDLVPIANGQVENDPLFLEAWTNLQKYEQLVKRKIVILDAIPMVTSHQIREINRMIASGEPLTKDIGGLQDFRNGQIRMRELMKRCSKCLLLNFNGLLTDDKGNLTTGEVRVFDPRTRLSYYTSGVHLTPAGLEAVEPAFERAAEQFSTDYKKWGY